MPRDMENHREWKRKKYEENKIYERNRKNKYNRDNREKINELQKLSYARNPEKYRARAKLKYAVKKWIINKPKNCWRCGSEWAINWHHTDYNKPLEVTWLCTSCHLLEHRWPRKKEYSRW